MPAYLTHRAAGERVLETVSVPHLSAFYLGCQGPDMLFFHNYQPWRRDKSAFELGVKMHSGKTRALLTHLLDYVQAYNGVDRDELISYAAGFLTHYAIDKIAHPFVYGKSGENDARHQAIEYMWDSYTSIEKWGIEPRQFEIYPEVMYGAIGGGICEWYSRAAHELYGCALSPDTVRTAQRQFAHGKQALSHIGPVRRFYLNLIGRTAGFDATCLLYPLSRDESMFSAAEYVDMQMIIAEGVRQARNMIPVALAAMSGDQTTLPAWFGDMNFAGELID
jgi:hypothetical protein